MRSPLARFIARTAIYLGGFAAILALFYIVADPLKTLRWYPRYNTDREQINAGVVTLANFDHYNATERYNFFIIGNSLSQYCHIEDWRLFIGDNARPYHLSSSSQSVFTTRRFLQHAADKADTVRHVLIAVDIYSLSDSTAGLADYYDTDPPGLFPPLMKLPAHVFYATHALNRSVLFGWAVRMVTGHFPKQENAYPRWRQDVAYNAHLNEISWPETEAWLDTATYAEVARFEQRGERLAAYRYHVESDMLGPGKENVENELRQIRAILDSTGADWRFVILPSSTGAVVSAHDDSVLRQIYGQRYHDMSTAASSARSNPRNFLDPGHPRPAIFREIMRQVYDRADD